MPCQDTVSLHRKIFCQTGVCGFSFKYWLKCFPCDFNCSCSAEDVWGEWGSDASGEQGSGGWEAVFNVRVWPQAVRAEDGAVDEAKGKAWRWGKCSLFWYLAVQNVMLVWACVHLESDHFCLSCLLSHQVKSLRIQVEQESSKRMLSQNDLKSRTLEVDRLRCTEKQLKQEINTALESKRSLEFQLAQLTKWAALLHNSFKTYCTKVESQMERNCPIYRINTFLVGNIFRLLRPSYQLILAALLTRGLNILLLLDLMLMLFGSQGINCSTIASYFWISAIIPA